jgi:hypothetical protein
MAANPLDEDIDRYFGVGASLSLASGNTIVQWLYVGVL